MLADPTAACRSIRDFLGAERSPLRVRLGQTTPHALEDVIEGPHVLGLDGPAADDESGPGGGVRALGRGGPGRRVSERA